MVAFSLTEKLASDIQWEAELQGLQVEQLLTKALRYQQQLYRSQRLKDELSWYEFQPLDYRAQFVGEFVAVYNHAVVDHDSDRHTLNQRISEEYGPIPILVIPAEGPREIRVYSPKVEQL